jgi:protein phosphatase
VGRERVLVTTSFRAKGVTHVGQVRSSNQDSFLETEDLFAVADGMGGHNGGEVASHIAIETLREHFTVPTTDALVDAIQAANDAVIAKAEDDASLRGMGTTLVALAAVVTDGEDRIAVANVGDSRCYLLEDDRLRQITKDHSVVQTLVDNGQITRAEAERHPQRNILTRALGIDPRVMTDSWELLPFAGDRYILCSDGLFNEVAESEIIRVLREQPNPGEAADELVQMANEGGGRDNISIVVIDVVEDNGLRAHADAARSRVATHTTGVHRAVALAAGTAHTTEPGDGAGGDGSAAPGGDGTATQGRARTALDDEPELERRGPSFRTIAFVGAVIAIVAAVIGTLVFAGRGTYYVGFDGDELTIFEGDPDALIGMDPQVKERTGLQRSEVPSSYLDELDDGRTFSSLEDAQEYVARIEADIAAGRGDRTGSNEPTRPTDTVDTAPSTTDPETDGTGTDDTEPDETTTTTDGGISRG